MLEYLVSLTAYADPAFAFKPSHDLASVGLKRRDAPI
jgi:hypothetical protein